MEANAPLITSQNKIKSRSSLYQTLWRWHFYAGIIFAPFLIILSITGSVYLFKPQIEESLYQTYYNVTPQDEKMAPSEQLSIVKETYPGATITSYRPGERANRSAEFHITTDDRSFTAFLNPYTGKSLGTLNDDDRIMDKIEEIHGELMAGKIGDRIVELAACWAIVLIVTGLFLWAPRKKTWGKGTLIPRLNKGKKLRRRDLHAIPAFWITGGMLFLIMTGLPWSGLWGTNFQTLVTNSGTGYPPSIWVGNSPTSTSKTKEIAEVPWAAENLDVPKSKLQGLVPLSLDDVTKIAEQKGLHPSYSVYLPQDKTGIYTFSAFPPKAQDEVTMHVDQYSGAVLADYRYEHYGSIGKAIALGITLHKGTQFGFLNQLISLLICLGIIFVAATGFYLWWKRKPKKSLGAPRSGSFKQMKLLFVLLLVFSVIFPLVGASLIIVWLIDVLVMKRIPSLKRFFNA